MQKLDDIIIFVSKMPIFFRQKYLQLRTDGQGPNYSWGPAAT
jgi:hypothetical protein